MPVEFFLDRSLGRKVLPRAMRSAGWPLVTMSEVYGTRPGERINDIQWIEEQTSAGRVLIASDAAILSVPDERAAVERCGAVFFVFPTPTLTAPVQFERLEKHRASIMRRSEAPGPAAFALYERVISSVLP